MKSWLKTAVRKDVVLRGIKVGGVVGTILVAINQGDLLLAGNLPPESLWKILLTYCHRVRSSAATDSWWSSR